MLIVKKTTILYEEKQQVVYLSCNKSYRDAYGRGGAKSDRVN